MVESPPANCPAKCIFSEDHRLLKNATGVVFHIPSGRGITEYKKLPGQFTVAYSMENVCYYPDLIDAAKIADLEMSYRRTHADVWTQYFTHKSLRDWPKNKTELVSVFVSNCGAHNDRLNYIRELSKYLPVHSYGACLHNMKKVSVDKVEKMKMYKFNLAFENCNTPDYVTEKIYQCLHVGTVPIYMGAPNAEDYLPPKSAIFVQDFKSAKDLATYLLELDSDDEKYNEYLKWKDLPYSNSFQRHLEETVLHSRCRLCLKIHEKWNDLLSSLR